jgi:hypothetical protein
MEFFKQFGLIITSQFSMNKLMLLEKLMAKNLVKLENLFSRLRMEMNFGLLLLKKLTQKLMVDM